MQAGGIRVAAEQQQGAEFDPIVDRDADGAGFGVLGFDELQARAAEIRGEQFPHRHIGDQASAEITVGGDGGAECRVSGR